MSSDNWIHRSDDMKCATCMWFVPKIVTKPNPPVSTEHERGELGRCRRHAPTMSGYPAVFESDWCGDHKPDENKI